jgi:hypothetical protein
MKENVLNTRIIKCKIFILWYLFIVTLRYVHVCEFYRDFATTLSSSFSYLYHFARSMCKTNDPHPFTRCNWSAYSTIRPIAKYRCSGVSRADNRAVWSRRPTVSHGGWVSFAFGSCVKCCKSCIVIAVVASRGRKLAARRGLLLIHLTYGN